MADVGASTLTRLLSKAFEASTGRETNTGMDDAGLGQVQEILDTTPTPSQMESTSAVGEVASWPPCDPAEIRSMDDFTSMSVTSAVGDMASWSSFDPSNLASQDDFVAMSATQDIRSN